MKIHIQSNFVIPGLEKNESVDFEFDRMSLRQFLEELSKRAPHPIEYVKPGAKTLNPFDWHVEVNHVPYQDCAGGLETGLKDGDIVTINIQVIAGG
jgi:hypothetical protein